MRRRASRLAKLRLATAGAVDRRAAGLPLLFVVADGICSFADGAAAGASGGAAVDETCGALLLDPASPPRASALRRNQLTV